MLPIHIHILNETKIYEQVLQIFHTWNSGNMEFYAEVSCLKWSFSELHELGCLLLGTPCCLCLLLLEGHACTYSSPSHYRASTTRALQQRGARLQPTSPTNKNLWPWIEMHKPWLNIKFHYSLQSYNNAHICSWSQEPLREI